MGLVACAPQATEDATEQKADENKTVQQVETPEPDKYGVVTAESWKDAYPDQYASYMENKSNAPLQDGGDKHNYLELYPALNTMYKGYAFALGYDRLITYTQADESGASLRAAGFRVIAARPPRAGWDTPSRRRTNKADNTPRTLWDAVDPRSADL